MSGAVLESALFTLKDGVTREAFMATVEGMSLWAAEYRSAPTCNGEVQQEDQTRQARFGLTHL
jgi:hypothetical protein